MFLKYIGAPILSAILCAIFVVFMSNEIEAKPITIQNYTINRIVSGLRWILLSSLPVGVIILLDVKLGLGYRVYFQFLAVFASSSLLTIKTTDYIHRSKIKRELYYEILGLVRSQCPDFEKNQDFKRDIYEIMRELDCVNVENDSSRDCFRKKTAEKIYEVCKKYTTTPV